MWRAASAARTSCIGALSDWAQTMVEPRALTTARSVNPAALNELRKASLPIRAARHRDKWGKNWRASTA
eukprot:CAMPEP_0176092918 /NCGR_PEP_ID=MMETSP0120_2-20121206/46555_1 /TAXON_ID=160619 /ORGANISM="Kryptoperidinium foliaceum, Strain CCMP 1326" /LENGTH=68 /DNA_ID=CAMNT_0017426843 /DNA_START=68 /DNA_END=270 /DNA_ORIENTATION=-